MSKLERTTPTQRIDPELTTDRWTVETSDGERPLALIVTCALSLLFRNDAFLLEHAAHERSITHKLAEYLQQHLSSYNVDCEYSKHGIGTKRLPRQCNDRDLNFVYPDIVVHSRGTDGNNLLVIEAKLRWSPDMGVPECDKAKLVEFTEPSGEYRYQLGLFIGFDGLKEPRLVWFKEGAELRSDGA